MVTIKDIQKIAKKGEILTQLEQLWCWKQTSTEKIL